MRLTWGLFRLASMMIRKFAGLSPNTTLFQLHRLLPVPIGCSTPARRPDSRPLTTADVLMVRKAASKYAKRDDRTMMAISGFFCPLPSNTGFRLRGSSTQVLSGPSVRDHLVGVECTGASSIRWEREKGIGFQPLPFPDHELQEVFRNRPSINQVRSSPGRTGSAHSMKKVLSRKRALSVARSISPWAFVITPAV